VLRAVLRVGDDPVVGAVVVSAAGDHRRVQRRQLVVGEDRVPLGVRVDTHVPGLVLRVQRARDDLWRARDDPVEVVGIALGHLHRLAPAVRAAVVVRLVGIDAVVVLDDLP